MAALRIASHGRAGAVSATGIASFGRLGKKVEIFLVPVEYTPFTIVTVLPSEIKDVEIESSQLVTVVMRSETGVEIQAYKVFVVIRDSQTSIEIIDPEDEVEI